MEEQDLIYLCFGFWTRFVMQIMFLLRKHIHLTLGLALLSDKWLLFFRSDVNPPPPPFLLPSHCIYGHTLYD